MYYQVITKAKRSRKLPGDVRKHFIKRLKERYDIEITMRECKNLEKRTCKYLLEYENNSRWWYLLRIDEKWVYCLFEKRYGLTTVLTPEQFWSSHPALKLRRRRVNDSYAEAWMVSRMDQEKYQTKSRRTNSQFLQESPVGAINNCPLTAD